MPITRLITALPRLIQCKAGILWFGVTVSQLCQWNDIVNPNQIYAGQALIV
ncbi:MAG: LysM peptidoglycan-binding domain-containing protein [Aeriscardovia sp.]|nr:LysM peptidoglycan-binding domain-containing protein [Aeriscardovia sp.]